MEAPLDLRLKGFLAGTCIIAIVASLVVIFTDLPRAEKHAAAPRLISECEKEIVDAVLAPAKSAAGRHAMALEIKHCDEVGLVTPEEKDFFLSSPLGDEMRTQGY
ncbi:hypothetical protein ATN84_19075 [Paramesorhizobium deserti]|uniref:Uncharacterized protein n=1 Tax=Paramesorhizobium deserti TaxID=1494590 RepID=A0A135HQ91_9HYPH|nr:hypothetical protein [Paramesorhizobium deserti]KXF75367.1 hypothetical protein ATN84_19075 [Paramesorhizobium deserti]